MKTIFIALVLFGVLIVGCTPTSELSLPTLTGGDAITVASTTAVVNGKVSENGGSTITAKGICWSTTPSPTIADSKTTDGSDIGSFTSSITGLSTM